MKTMQARVLLLVVTLADVAAFFVPFEVVFGAATVGFLALRKGRVGMMWFAASTIAINTLLLAWITPGTPHVAWGPITLGAEGAWTGLVGAMRLVALVALNLAVLSWVPPAVWLEGLRLPPRATAFVAAVVIASHDLARDFGRLREAQQLTGTETTRWQRIRHGASLLPALMVAAHHRARIRRDAMRLAGIATGPRFAPVVAITALAVAGRLAFVAIPNVSLAYVVVFLGGLVFGARVGAAAGALAMALTDLMLTGLLPTPFVNVPAMAMVGLLGGLGRNLNWSGDGRADRVAGMAFAATAGIVATFLFSVVSDALEWWLVPEFRASTDLLRVRVLAGLAFNVLPAITNAVLFAVSVAPVQRAFTALEEAKGEARPV